MIVSSWRERTEEAAGSQGSGRSCCWWSGWAEDGGWLGHGGKGGEETSLGGDASVPLSFSTWIVVTLCGPLHSHQHAVWFQNMHVQLFYRWMVYRESRIIRSRHIQMSLPLHRKFFVVSFLIKRKGVRVVSVLQASMVAKVYIVTCALLQISCKCYLLSSMPVT